MAETLTPAQREAVENRGGKLLVSAAAGSGKTKVLVDRLMGYLMDPADPADLDEFLIITYTRAAASELRAKIAKKLNEHIAANPEDKHLQKQLQRLYLTEISTVHGFCGDILKEYAYRLDLDADFRVADENACQELREEVLKDLLDNAYIDLLEDAGFRAFADTQGLGRTDKALPELITKVYDSARCHPDPESWLDGCLLGNLTQAEGAEETPWGKFLMEDLFRFLDGQIAALERCVELAGEAPTVQNNLADTLHQLKHLRESSTWDEAVDRIRISFGRLVFPRKGDPVPRKEEIKAVREACKEGLAKQGKIFSRNSGSIEEPLFHTFSLKMLSSFSSVILMFPLQYFAALLRRLLTILMNSSLSTLAMTCGSQSCFSMWTSLRWREILNDLRTVSTKSLMSVGTLLRMNPSCSMIERSSICLVSSVSLLRFSFMTSMHDAFSSSVLFGDEMISKGATMRDSGVLISWAIPVKNASLVS